MRIFLLVGCCVLLGGICFLFVTGYEHLTTDARIDGAVGEARNTGMVARVTDDDSGRKIHPLIKLALVHVAKDDHERAAAALDEIKDPAIRAYGLYLATASIIGTDPKDRLKDAISFTKRFADNKCKGQAFLLIARNSEQVGHVADAQSYYDAAIKAEREFEHFLYPDAGRGWFWWLIVVVVCPVGGFIVVSVANAVIKNLIDQRFK